MGSLRKPTTKVIQSHGFHNSPARILGESAAQDAETPESRPGPSQSMRSRPYAPRDLSRRKANMAGHPIALSGGIPGVERAV